jgi:Cu2+-exporting ATPase
MTLAAAHEAPPSPAGGLLLDDPQELSDYTRTAMASDGTVRSVSQFVLSGLHCGACAGIIEGALLQVDGVLAATVSSDASVAEVTWDPARTRPSTMVAAIQRAGYDAAPDLAAPARELRDRAWRRSLWQLFVAGFCMMQVMMYAAPAYFAEPGDIEPDLLRLLQWASWLLSIPVLLFSASDLLQGAWRNVRSRRLGMDVPVALGIVVTFVASTAATFAPGGLFGHEVYFDSLTMFVFFLLAGRALELRARHRIAAALEGKLADLPDSVARIEPDGSLRTVTRRQLRVGDRVQVAAGQCFPADGRLIEGLTQASEALLTGESSPVAKQPGDAVSAGSFNLMAPVIMMVEQLGADTRLEAIAALVRSALTTRPEAVRLADRWAGVFLAAVLVLAAGAAAVWSAIDPSRAVWVAVSVLIVTCPCALSLATPSALLSAAGTLARQGVLLQRLGALETLARVDWLFIDKTGTLTEDRMDLTGVVVQPQAQALGLDRVSLLNRAANLASHSTHPLSRALVAAAGMAAGPGDWHHVEERPGEGLLAQATDGRRYRLGSLAWVRGGNNLLAKNAPQVSEASSAALELWFGLDGETLARFDMAETLRPDASAALARLQQAGVHVALLSGDRRERVDAMARRLGLRDARGGATPQSKLQAVADAQAEGHCVAMVGDGLNDAPVLACADVSFAFAHGAALSRGHADVVLLGQRLSAVADARDLAQRSVRVIRQNLAWAALYNGSCIPLALLGWLPPWAAGLGMAGSSLLVVLNALRLARAPVLATGVSGPSNEANLPSPASNAPAAA